VTKIEVDPKKAGHKGRWVLFGVAIIIALSVSWNFILPEILSSLSTPLIKHRVSTGGTIETIIYNNGWYWQTTYGLIHKLGRVSSTELQLARTSAQAAYTVSPPQSTTCGALGEAINTLTIYNQGRERILDDSYFCSETQDPSLTTILRIIP